MRRSSPPIRPRIVLALLGAALVSPVQGSGTLFVTRCAGNCTYTGAPAESACNNTSSIIASGAHQLTAYSGDDTDWAEVLACVRSVLDPFDVAVTDVDPGCASHHEVAVAGLPTQVGFPDGVLGVAPFDCGDSPNRIAFVFANHPLHALRQRLCTTIVHEFAHLIGLDHETLPRDPMSYVEDCYSKRFTPVESPCGTLPGDEQLCVCGGDSQSSFSMLTDRLGAAPGLIFGDGFDNFQELEVVGSTCHWDAAPGEDPPPPFAGPSSVTPYCATDFSAVSRRP